MSKHWYLSFLLLGLSFTSMAQMEIDRLERYYYSDSSNLKGSFVNLYSNAQLNASAVTNALIRNLLYTGKFIDDNLKDQTSKRLFDHNRLGADITIGLQGQYEWKNGISFQAGLSHREFYAAGFTGDIFKLIFYGNSAYAGQTADLSKSKFKGFNYESLYLGVSKETNKLTIGGGLQFLRGGRYQEAYIKRGTMYTDPFGAYIDFDTDFSVRFTPADSNIIPKSNGKGLALNLQGSYQLGKGTLSFEARDLGFISWKNVQRYYGDSTYRYDGVFINDIFSTNTSITDQVQIDSITKQIGLKRDSSNYTMMLPATLHANYSFRFNNAITFLAGIKYYLRAANFPRVYARAYIDLGKQFTFAPTLAYGGFGRLDVELGLAKNLGDSWLFSTNLFFLEYFTLPAHSSGHGLNFSIVKLFK